MFYEDLTTAFCFSCTMFKFLDENKLVLLAYVVDTLKTPSRGGVYIFLLSHKDHT